MRTDMNKRIAITRLLSFTSAGQVDTLTWQAMGWPLEGFLRFGQLTEELADANLAAAQAAIIAAGQKPPLPVPYTLKVERDEDPQSPDEWGNGDIFIVADHRQFAVHRDGFDPRSETLTEDHPEYAVYRLQAYIHSGVMLSLGAFDCPWDSGQVGWVFVKKDGGFPDIEKAAEAMVEEWNDCLSGNIYGFVIEDEDGEIIESCWGFHGEESAREEGEPVLASLNAERGCEPQENA